MAAQDKTAEKKYVVGDNFDHLSIGGRAYRTGDEVPAKAFKSPQLLAEMLKTEQVREVR